AEGAGHDRHRVDVGAADQLEDVTLRMGAARAREELASDEANEGEVAGNSRVARPLRDGRLVAVERAHQESDAWPSRHLSHERSSAPRGRSLAAAARLAVFFASCLTVAMKISGSSRPAPALSRAASRPSAAARAAAALLASIFAASCTGNTSPANSAG